MLHPFAYTAPRSKAELLRILDAEREDARLLAGGTDLVVEIRAGRVAPRRVVDVKKVEGLGRLSFDAREGLSIGATVTCAEILADATVRERFPVLCGAAAKLGSPQLRNRATAAGNVCTASPCADLGTALLAFDAAVEIESLKGRRTVPLREFYLGVKRTVLGRDELVTGLTVPAALAGATGGMEKLKRIKGHDLALASVVLVRKNGSLRVAVGSCAPTPVVTPVLPSTASADEVVAAARKVVSPIDDLRASAAYRAFMVETFVRRLVSAGN